MKKIFLLLLSAQYFTMLSAQEEIPLFEKQVPNSKPSANREKSEMGKDGVLRISKVSIPTLTIFLPAKDKSNGTAVIICPGGGYSSLSFNSEGTDEARLFNEWGVAAFVLKYRLPDDSTMLQKEIGPLQDAQRAIQLIRKNAGKWKIKKNQIGIMGFSAGGHLAATAGTHFTNAVLENKHHISLRPDFLILIYPVISFTDSLAHMGSRNNLIGRHPTEEQVILYSNELQITKQTPPTFLVHAMDDGGVKVRNSTIFYETLRKNAVPAEIHLYEKGGHGFGMNNKTTDDKWMDRLKVWMEKNKWIK